MKHLILTTALALSFFAEDAQAGTVTYNSRGFETVSVPMFDPAMGFLTAVDYRMTGAIGWTDTDNSYTLLTASAYSDIRISFRGQSMTATDRNTTVCGDVIIDPKWGTECRSALSASAYAMAEIVRSLSLENGDNLPLQFNGTRSLVGKATGWSGPRSYIGDALSTTLSITYTFADAPPDPLPAAYAALPLPASAPLLLAGLGGIAVLRRRRAHQQKTTH